MSRGHTFSTAAGSFPLQATPLKVDLGDYQITASPRGVSSTVLVAAKMNSMGNKGDGSFKRKHGEGKRNVVPHPVLSPRRAKAAASTGPARALVAAVLLEAEASLGANSKALHAAEAHVSECVQAWLTRHGRADHKDNLRVHSTQTANPQVAVRLTTPRTAASTPRQRENNFTTQLNWTKGLNHPPRSLAQPVVATTRGVASVQVSLSPRDWFEHIAHPANSGEVANNSATITAILRSAEQRLDKISHAIGLPENVERRASRLVTPRHPDEAVAAAVDSRRVGLAWACVRASRTLAKRFHRIDVLARRERVDAVHRVVEAAEMLHADAVERITFFDETFPTLYRLFPSESPESIRDLLHSDAPLSARVDSLRATGELLRDQRAAEAAKAAEAKRRAREAAALAAAEKLAEEVLAEAQAEIAASEKAVDDAMQAGYEYHIRRAIEEDNRKRREQYQSILDIREGRERRLEEDIYMFEDTEIGKVKPPPVDPAIAEVQEARAARIQHVRDASTALTTARELHDQATGLVSELRNGPIAEKEANDLCSDVLAEAATEILLEVVEDELRHPPDEDLEVAHAASSADAEADNTEVAFAEDGDFVEGSTHPMERVDDAADMIAREALADAAAEEAIALAMLDDDIL